MYFFLFPIKVLNCTVLVKTFDSERESRFQSRYLRIFGLSKTNSSRILTFSNVSSSGFEAMKLKKFRQSCMSSRLNPGCALRNLFSIACCVFIGSIGFSLSLRLLVSFVVWTSSERPRLSTSLECELSPSCMLQIAFPTTRCNQRLYCKNPLLIRQQLVLSTKSNLYSFRNYSSSSSSTYLMN